MITEQDLAVLAGDKNYNKGKKIASSGDVHLQKFSEHEITGIVSGSCDYQVSVSYLDNSYGFSCTCPAFEYQEVCKHCVAIVLASQYDIDDGSAIDNNVATHKNDQDAILRRYIEALPANKLSKALYELICIDKNHYNRWLTKAQLSSDKQDIKSLKKLVTKALPLRSIWGYREVADYFTNAEKNIDDVLEAGAVLSADDNLQLIFHIYDRLEKILERVDDSGGYRFGIQHQLAVALPEIVKRQEWNSEQLALWLNKALAFDYECFPAIPDDFQIDKNEMQAFLSLCQAQFNAVEVNVNISQRQHDLYLKQRGEILLRHQPQAKEFEVALKLRAKMASDLNDALKICQFCLDNDDELTAEDWLIKAESLASFGHQKSHWDDQAIKVYVALGEIKRAWRIAWQRFKARPEYHTWKRLESDIKVIGWQPDNLNTDAETLLLGAAKQSKAGRLHRTRDDIIYFYLAQKDFTKAVCWLDKNKAGEAALTKAVSYLAEAYPEKAVLYCARALSLILQYADNSNYEKAVLLLKELQEKLPIDETIQESFKALVKDVVSGNSRRPNMIKKLRMELGQYL